MTNKFIDKTGRGWKAYTAGGLMIFYGLLGLLLNQMDAPTAITVMLNGLGVIGIRHAL